MTRDIDVLRIWILVVALIAAVGTNAVPIIYLLTPWRAKMLGRLFMLQAISFALAMDMSLILTLWQPSNVLVIFWINALVLTTIACSTSAMAWLILMLKRTNGKYEWKGRTKVLFTNKVYARIKFIAMILLPALASLYFGVAQLWHLPKAEEVVGTITLIDTFLGFLLRMSTNTYNDLDHPMGKYDGTVVLQPGDEGTTVGFKNLDPGALETKRELVLKIERS